MGRSGNLNRAQRVVLVVTLGVVLVVVVVGLTNQWNSPRIGEAGWFAYAPNTGAIFSEDSSSWPIWRDVLTWLGAVALWCTAALYLLRSDLVADGAAVAEHPGMSRRELGTALGWVVFVVELGLGIAFGWLWWLIAGCTAAGLVLSVPSRSAAQRPAAE